MKKSHVVVYSALLLLLGSVCSQAQQSLASTRNGDSNALLSALAIPVGLAAQANQQQGPAQDSANAGTLTIITFDVPGSTWTIGSSINPAGVIAGPYTSADHYHGFLRAADGTFTTFDVPGAVNTSPVGINPAGAVTGNYFDANGVTHGFLRAASGTFTSFDPPGATVTYAYSINSGGAITGPYQDANGVQHGFLRAADGT